MKQVNFLPSELYERQVTHRTIPFLVIALIAGVAAVVLPWVILRSINSDLEAQVTKQQNNLGLNPSTVSEAQAASVQRQVNDVTNRTKILNLLATQEVNWAKVFQVVQNSVPKEVVLSTYNVSIASGDITLHMSGTSPSNLSFASFVDALKSNTQINKVVVDGFAYSPTNGSVTFSLTLGIKPQEVLFQVHS